MSDFQTLLNAWTAYADELRAFQQEHDLPQHENVHLYRLMAHAGSSERILAFLQRKATTDQITNATPGRPLENRPGRFQGKPPHPL